MGEIHDYIAADAPDTAADFCEVLIQATQQLAEFPYVGALMPENPAYRQLVMAGYRIVYRIDEGAVYVMTVVSPGDAGGTGGLAFGDDTSRCRRRLLPANRCDHGLTQRGDAPVTQLRQRGRPAGATFSLHSSER